MNNLVIGSKIRSKRIAKGLSQEVLASSLSISQSAYAKIEQGKTRIDIERLLKIAELLNEDVVNLLNNESGNTVHFHGGENHKGFVETLYESNKDLYEQQISHLKGEVEFLRTQLSGFTKK